MSASIRETALQAIKSGLAATGTPATGGVFRSRLEQIDTGDLPCYDITPGDETVEDTGEYSDNESVTRCLPVTVRAMIDAGQGKGAGDSIDDSALDPFYVWAIQKIVGADSNLGGVVIHVKERGTAVVFQPAGKDIIGLEMNFELCYATLRGDPTQRA